VISPGDDCETSANVSITRSGLVTYSVEFAASCAGISYSSPLITLVSAAFNGCSLSAGPSDCPQQGNMGMDYNSTVTGSLVGSSLSLAAEWLSCVLTFPNDTNTLSASWQLQCPVRPVSCCWGSCRVVLSRLCSDK
jgi:hypothetical protein